MNRLRIWSFAKKAAGPIVLVLSIPAYLDGAARWLQWLRPVPPEAVGVTLSVVGLLTTAVLTWPRRRASLPDSADLGLVPERAGPAPPPPREESDPSSDDPTDYWWHNTSTAVFSRRMGKAFPGARGLIECEGADAVDRLEVLLEAPLVSVRGDREKEPIWWFRAGMSNAVRSFERTGPDTCRIGRWEAAVSRAIAYRSHDWRRDFLYVEISPGEPTGLYDVAPGVADIVGYKTEAFGSLGGHLLTYHELEDGFAQIDGQAVDVSDVPERERILSRFNFIICGKSSPINATSFDRISTALLDEYPMSWKTMEQLVAEVEKAPLHKMDFSALW